MRCTGSIERLDRALASLAAEEAGLRLRLGQLPEIMGRGAVSELGFSSLGAYAVERCERSVRWAEGARCLARRLEELPALRGALAIGNVSWSMAELLARVAAPTDEVRWLELAGSRTVRRVRVLVAEAIAARRETATCETALRAPGIEGLASSRGADDVAGAENDSLTSLESGGSEICTVTCTVAREDAWLFEATRCLLEQLGVHGAVARERGAAGGGTGYTACVGAR
jgi:hypothetical protein